MTVVAVHVRCPMRLPFCLFFHFLLRAALCFPPDPQPSLMPQLSVACGVPLQGGLARHILTPQPMVNMEGEPAVSMNGDIGGGKSRPSSAAEEVVWTEVGWHLGAQIARRENQLVQRGNHHLVFIEVQPQPSLARHCALRGQPVVFKAICQCQSYREEMGSCEDLFARTKTVPSSPQMTTNQNCSSNC